MNATCTLPACEKPSQGRKWCSAHFAKFYRYGDPLAIGPGKGRVAQPVEPRLMAGLVSTGVGCWEWQRSRNADGYGQICVNGRVERVHRVMYELKVGPIPEGKLVMHICDNPPCANPDHLRLGTDAENNADRDAKGRNYYRNQTHCPHGHLYDQTNTRWLKNGKRACIACSREQSLRGYYRRRARLVSDAL